MTNYKEIDFIFMSLIFFLKSGHSLLIQHAQKPHVIIFRDKGTWHKKFHDQVLE